MNYKNIAQIVLGLSFIILLVIIFTRFIPLTNVLKVSGTNVATNTNGSNEKRGTPSYDYIIGKDNLPHYRVFFWVPLNVTHFTPYADSEINTYVSNHGSIENWSVVVTTEVNFDSKLVFIYVPKTFVFLYGNGFQDVIHLNYY